MGVDGDPRMVLCHSMNPDSVKGIPSGRGDAQTLSNAKEFYFNFLLSGDGDAKNFRHKCSLIGASPQAITSYFHFQMSPLQLGNYNNNAVLCKLIYMTMKKRCKSITTSSLLIFFCL